VLFIARRPRFSFIVMPGASSVNDRRRNPRRYPPEFKLQVVREALSLPEHSRIKPTARRYPGVTPVQVRMWIKNIAALEEAAEKQRDQRAQELAQHQSSAPAMPFFVPPSPKPQLIFLPSHQCGGWNHPYVQSTVAAAPPAVAPQMAHSASTPMPFLAGGHMHAQQLVMPPMNGSSSAMHQFPAPVQQMQTSPMVHCSTETGISPAMQTSMQPSMQPPHVPPHMQHPMPPPNQHVRQSAPQIPSLPNSYVQPRMASFEHVISPPISPHEQTNDQQAVQDLLELARPEAPLWGL